MSEIGWVVVLHTENGPALGDDVLFDDPVAADLQGKDMYGDGYTVEPVGAPQDFGTDAVSLARLFHENYERLASEHGYKTRDESAVPWHDVPEPNRSLMVAVAREIIHIYRVGAPQGERIEGWVRSVGRGRAEFWPHDPGDNSRRATLLLHPEGEDG